MPKYCCVNDVIEMSYNKIPQFIADKFPELDNSELNLKWEAHIEGWIELVSADIDAAVGISYPYLESGQKFPDRDKGCPGSIVQAAIYLIKSKIASCFPMNTTDESNPERDYRAAAERILTDIRDGKRCVLPDKSSKVTVNRSRNNQFTQEAFDGWGVK